MHDVKIQRLLEETLITSDGKVQPVIRVTFSVGEHGPFTERFPREGFDVSAARRKLDEFARQIVDLTR